MLALVSKKQVQEAVSGIDPWRIGNETLYELCRRHPTHTDQAEIVAKVWLIGRAYSASIERGRGKGASAHLPNDRFYAEAVPEALRRRGIDRHIRRIAKLEANDDAAIPLVLAAHQCLVDVFSELTGKDKRSLASKYLHFHLPEHVFIFDSRVAEAIRTLRLDGRDTTRNVYDRAYAKFVGEALVLCDAVLTEHCVRLTPRQLDRLLLAAFQPMT